MFFGKDNRVGWIFERDLQQLRLWGLWITRFKGWTIWFGQTRVL